MTQLGPSVCKLDDRAKSSPLFPLLLHAMDGDALFPPLIIALYNLEKWTPVLQQPCSEYLSLLFNSRSGHFSSQIISPAKESQSRGIYRRNSGGHDRRFLFLRPFSIWQSLRPTHALCCRVGRPLSWLTPAFCPRGSLQPGLLTEGPHWVSVYSVLLPQPPWLSAFGRLDGM